MRPIDADALVYKLTEIVRHSTGEYKFGVDAARLVAMEAPTAGGWISVKDRMPEDEGDVLVYGVSPRGRKKIAIENYLAFEDDRPRWALDGIWTVLYWMPLPKPPKEENEDA